MIDSTAIPRETRRIPAILHDRTGGALWIQGVTFLWFVSTFALFPGNDLLLYPLTATFFAILYFERDRIAPILFRCWFLFLIPIMCAFSVFWSPYPSEALRIAMFFTLSSITMVIVGSLLTERQILRAFFFCAIIGTALAIAELGNIRATQNSEYLGQKNYYAMKMLISMIASFAIMINKKEHPVLRLAGLVLVPVDFYLIYAANSATSLVLSLLALALLLGGHFLWVQTRAVRGMRTLILGFTLILGIVAVLVVFDAMQGSSLDQVLGLVGRDTTFTGRTALWDQAHRTSAEHPVLGVGAGGFWHYDVGAAQSLVLNEGRGAGTKLGFHSSYLEAQVHLGYVGLSLLILMVSITLWKTTKTMIVDATSERTCLFVAAIIIFSMTFTESLIFAYLHPGIFIFNLAAITAIVSGRRKKQIFLNLVPIPDPTPDQGASHALSRA